MPVATRSLTWVSNRALLVVGNLEATRRGWSPPPEVALAAALGDKALASLAVYHVAPDVMSDWFVERLNITSATTALLQHVEKHLGAEPLPRDSAEAVVDELSAVLSIALRDYMQLALLRQFQQIVLDADRSGVARGDQRISILCHHMGCFFVFEALHAAVSDSRYRLQPATDGVSFDNVILLGSPLQLIRSTVQTMGHWVPAASRLAVLQGNRLSVPCQRAGLRSTLSVRHWRSLVSSNDPLSGYVAGRRIDPAFTNLPGQETSIVDVDRPGSFADYVGGGKLVLQKSLH